MFLCMLHDLIKLATIHLTTMSWIMRQIYRWEISALYSLWNLFRGEFTGSGDENAIILNDFDGD